MLWSSSVQIEIRHRSDMCWLKAQLVFIWSCFLDEWNSNRHKLLSTLFHSNSGSDVICHILTLDAQCGGMSSLYICYLLLHTAVRDHGSPNCSHGTDSFDPLCLLLEIWCHDSSYGAGKNNWNSVRCTVLLSLLRLTEVLCSDVVFCVRILQKVQAYKCFSPWNGP